MSSIQNFYLFFIVRNKCAGVGDVRGLGNSGRHSLQGHRPLKIKHFESKQMHVHMESPHVACDLI